MFIDPIDSIGALTQLQKESSAGSAAPAGLPFQSIFEEAVQNVKDTDAAVGEQLELLATGQTDDIHNLVIASNKATLSVQLLVQLRDKALEAYNDLMRMNV